MTDTPIITLARYNIIKAQYNAALNARAEQMRRDRQTMTLTAVAAKWKVDKALASRILSKVTPSRPAGP